MKQSEYTPKEQAVFAAVLRLAGRGVDLAGLKVQQIADEAGMGKGTLYEYFKSKDEILQGTVRWCLADEYRQITELTAGVQTMDQLLQRSADYIDGLVAQRFEAYRIIAEMLKTSSRPEPDCGKMDGVMALLQRMLDADYEMALATGWLTDGVEREYFRYVVFHAMVGYAMSLATAFHHAVPTEAEKARKREFFVRSVCSCLHR